MAGAAGGGEAAASDRILDPILRLPALEMQDARSSVFHTLLPVAEQAPCFADWVPQHSDSVIPRDEESRRCFKNARGVRDPLPAGSG